MAISIESPGSVKDKEPFYIRAFSHIGRNREGLPAGISNLFNGPTVAAIELNL